MTVKECYAAFGGDYDDVMARMPGEDFVAEFLREFAKDENYNILCAAMKNKDAKEAFRAVHSLKGICQNFGYTKLFASASMLTELLRTGSFADTEIPMLQVTVDYQRMLTAIQALDADR